MASPGLFRPFAAAAFVHSVEPFEQAAQMFGALRPVVGKTEIEQVVLLAVARMVMVLPSPA